MADAWREARHLAPLSAERALVSFPSTATFSPLAYLPQATGIGFARAVGGNLFTQIIAGRVANLVAFLIFAGLIHRILPGARSIFLAIMFMPTALHLAASLSADAMNLALPALLIALCIRLRMDDGFALTGARRWSIAGLVIVCGLLKPIYILFALPILLIPPVKFAGAKSRLAFVIACLGVSVAASVAWNLSFPFVPGLYWGNGADPQAAVALFLHDPAHVADIAIHTLSEMWFEWFRGCFGAIGGEGGFAYFVTSPVLRLAMLILAALALVDSLPRRDLSQSALFGFVAVAFLLALLAAFFIGFTRLGAARIEGINGRYLFLFYMLMAWAIASLRLRVGPLTAAAPAPILGRDRGGSLCHVQRPAVVPGAVGLLG